MKKQTKESRMKAYDRMQQILREKYEEHEEHSNEGPGMVEYAIILVLVAAVVIAALTVMGPMVRNVFMDQVVKDVQATIIEKGYTHVEVGIPEVSKARELCGSVQDGYFDATAKTPAGKAVDLYVCIGDNTNRKYEVNIK